VSSPGEPSAQRPSATAFSQWLDTLVPAMFPTDAELARRAGVDRSLIPRWRRGTTTPSPRVLYSLASATGVSLEYLVTIAGYRPPKPAQRDVPSVIAAVVTSHGRVLIGRRHDGTPPWTFIAGEQEPGEQPADTIIREVKEETTLEIRAGEVIGERDHPQTGRHMIYLAAAPAGGTGIAVGDEAELAEVLWASLAEAIELLPGMFPAVRDHLSRVLAAPGEDRP
jgi:8-oxo-dGTP pyrophosphatase MutT (NUDIX family)